MRISYWDEIVIVHNVFEGTRREFQNKFHGNGTNYKIELWCVEHGHTLNINGIDILT